MTMRPATMHEGLERERRIGTSDRHVVVMGCLKVLSFVAGYAWPAGWLGGTAPVEPALAHCALGGSHPRRLGGARRLVSALGDRPETRSRVSRPGW
jgi:hypothetical protein